MLRFARSVLAVVALLFAAVSVLPLVHWQKWAEAQGYKIPLLERAEPTFAQLNEIAESTTSQFVMGFLIGGALLVWLDFGLRQRTRKMGLILASVGLVTFVVGVGIYLFPRQSRFAIAAVTPPPPVKEQQREALAWSKTPILRWSQAADGTIYAHSLGFIGKNTGDEEVQLDEIYIVSRTSNARIDLKVQIGNEGAVAAQETNPIPPGAYIQLSSDDFNPALGLTEADFLRDWGAIDFIAEYGGQRHQLAVEPTAIAALFDAQRPTPHLPIVTRRPDAHVTTAPSTSKLEQTEQGALKDADAARPTEHGPRPDDLHVDRKDERETRGVSEETVSSTR